MRKEVSVIHVSHEFDVVCPKCKENECKSGSISPDDPKLNLILTSVEIGRYRSSDWGVESFVIITGTCANCDQKVDLFNVSAKLFSHDISQTLLTETIEFLRAHKVYPNLGETYLVPPRAFRSFVPHFVLEQAVNANPNVLPTKIN